MEPAAEAAIEQIIEDNTTPELRSKYNGRLTDNLLQWASDEMNTRLDLNASGARHAHHHVITSSRHHGTRLRLNASTRQSLITQSPIAQSRITHHSSLITHSSRAGEQLITLAKSDFEAAIKRFNTTKPPTKADPTLAGGQEVPRGPSTRPLHAAPRTRFIARAALLRPLPPPTAAALHAL